MYIQVNIGRNNDIGIDPMPQTEWDEFAGRVAFAIYATANCYEAFDMLDDIELHDGYGTYNGIREDSRHISSHWEDGFDVEQLKSQLVDIKKMYGQDTVALILGSELI